VRAAIGISGPAERLKPRTLAGLGRVVREIAARLSHDLGAPNA
jgi:DNA-binding IclR family transcriptional regulator